MRRVKGALFGAVLVAGTTISVGARALPNDIQLSLLGSPDPLPNGMPAIAQDPLAQERFARFASEFALALAPLPSGPPTSVGQAGFEVTISESIADIHPHQTFSNGSFGLVWPTEGTPPDQLALTTLHVRKGLPLSLELAVDVSYLANSSICVPSIMLKWTLLEGLLWIPDVDIAAFASTPIGVQYMTMVIWGWDIGVGYKIPLIGSSSLDVYGGYQMIGMDASTTNIPFDPNHQDPSNSQSDDVFSTLSYGSDPLFPSTHFNRVYFGAQLKWDIWVLGIEAADAWGTNADQSPPLDPNNTVVNFSTSMWKFGFRTGVSF